VGTVTPGKRGSYADFGELFEELYRQVRPPEEVRDNGHGTRRHRSSPHLGDDEILEKVRRSKNAEKFEMLFDAGEISAYAGESEADYALLAILRFWTQDPDQVEGLMRRSALYRPRWDKRHSGGRSRLRYSIERSLHNDGRPFETYSYMKPAAAREEDAEEEIHSDHEQGVPPDGDRKAFRERFKTPAEIMADARKEEPWIAEPWLARGGITDLAGAAKLSGKSTWMMHMAAAILRGRYFMGRKCVKSPVVYLSEQGNNIEKALRSAGLEEHPDLHIMLRHMAHGLTWPQILKAAVLMCKDVGALVLMVDTLNRFAGLVGEQENQAGPVAEAMTPLLDAARRQDLAVMVSRHANHEGRGRGSTQFLHDVDIVLTMRVPDATAANNNARRLEAHGRYDHIPLVTNITLEKENGAERYVDNGSSAKMQREAAEKAITETISEHNRERVDPPTKDELVEACKGAASEPTVRRAMEDLVGRGEIQRVGKGVKGSPHRYQFIPVTDGGLPPDGDRNESEDF
jgi:AAA domain